MKNKKTPEQEILKSVGKKSNHSGRSVQNRRTTLRMSKFARKIQSTLTQTNWQEMAKILFWADSDQTRHDEVVRLHAKGETPSPAADAGYSLEQSQFLLVLLLILTTAEKRIQELYHQHFSARCDSISQAHGLKDDQFWIKNEIPQEWDSLDQEFEKRSVQILLDTLREYSMDAIADHLETAGPEQFYDIIARIEPQFSKVLRQPGRGALNAFAKQSGSIPEMLQSSSNPPRGKTVPNR